MRYQSFSLRLARLREAADRFGWTEEVLGTSSQGRPIVGFVKNGGVKRILAWSLMHGNEPTGYEALVAFMQQNDHLSHCCLIPILNPDGAEAFTRHNADGVDVNRDARAQESAEARTLVRAFRNFCPEMAINLHDQRPRFYPEGGSLPSTFSLLAPKGHPDNPSELQSRAQKRAQAALAMCVDALATTWDGGISRFDDQYYPSAFGEYFQEQGIATITIETGISLDDWSRLRVAVHLADLLRQLDSCLHWSSLPEDVAPYLSLPFNASPANEWVIHHADGIVHLRHHETVLAGQYHSGWIVDEMDLSRPTWMASRTPQALGSPSLGHIYASEALQAFGLSPDFGLRI